MASLDVLRHAIGDLRIGECVSVDDFREVLDGADIDSSELGMLFRQAVQAGWLAPTGRIANSRKASRRGGIIREYRVTGELEPLKHAPGCPHCKRVRAMANDYRLARHAAEERQEAVTRGYATEQAEYGRLITFKDWLIDTSRTG